MRVLHVAQPTTGGVAGYVRAAGADQAARGWDVHVAAPTTGTLSGCLDTAGLAHHPWHAARGPGRHTADETRRLRRLVADIAPDVVHLHSATAGLAGRLAVRARVPTLFQPHGWSWLPLPEPAAAAAAAWERLAARWAHAVVCVGEGEAHLGRSRGIPGRRLTVVRNGIDRRHFRPAGDDDKRAARQHLGLTEQAPLALCPGRISRQKGQDLLVREWPRARALCAEAQLVLLGDGDPPPTVPGVHTRPGTAAVRAWYAAADVIVLPSRWEGLPLTVLEAMASARPVVVSDIPGLAEVVPDGAGAVVNGAAPLAAATAHRLANPTLARAEGRAAARHAAQFDIDDTYDALAALTEQVSRAGQAAKRRTA